MTESKEPKVAILSKEFKVAAQIYECNIEGKKIWFTKLAELLSEDMSPPTVMKALRSLSDWGIAKAEFGETGKGRAGRLLFIAGEEKATIKEIYEKYWKNRNK